MKSTLTVADAAEMLALIKSLREEYAEDTSFDDISLNLWVYPTHISLVVEFYHDGIGIGSLGHPMIEAHRVSPKAKQLLQNRVTILREN